MRRHLEILILVITLIAEGALSCSLLVAQSAPSIEEQLQAQYQLVKMGSDSSGPTVLQPGTVLVIQQGGILGTPWGSPKGCPAKFKDDDLQPPGKFCTAARGHGGSHAGGWLKNHIPGSVSGDVSDSSTDTSSTQYFKVGDKVYPTKIDVNPKKESIAFSIVACDTCNGTNPPTYYKSEVDFQFAKGFLQKGDVSKIEDTIGKVFSIDNSSDSQQGQGAQAGQGPDQGQPQAQGGQDQGQASAAPAGASAPAQPQSIQQGQTPAQVEAALGQPDKTVDLGSKKIWVYKDLKVTFVNGKVSDVQ
jgi:hypothetical protein